MRVNKRKLFAILLFIFVVSLAFQFTLLDGTAFAQGKVKCYVCGKELQPGTYWLFGNKPVCQNCYNTLPKCEICKIPVKNFVYVDGKRVCYDCYYKLYSCSICGRKAIKLWTLKDTSTGITKSYCDDCIAKYGPRCAACGQPLVNSSSSSGDYVEITSKVTLEKKYYCENCYKTLKKCDICGLLVKAGIRPLSDGRYLCEDCLKTAVFDYNEVKAIYDEVVPAVQNILGSKIETVPPLYLVDQKQLKDVQKETDSFSVNELGFYYRDKLYLSDNNKYKPVDPRIYILFGEPRSIIFWSVAHEFGHAWFSENCPPNQSNEIVEGFAQWVAYKMALIKGYNNEINKQMSRPDVYGSGLRKLVEIENRGGARAVLKYVKTAGY